MFCKTIILSNSENLNSNAPKGILTLSQEKGLIKGKIRLYNILSLPAGTKVGLYINEKVHIFDLTKKPQHYEFDLEPNVDITQSIYCALIDNSNHDKKVLLEGGNFNGFYFTDSPFDAVLEAKDEELEQTIDEAMANLEQCEQCNCSNCEYKNYFYSNYPTTSTNLTQNDQLLQEDTSIIENLSQENSDIIQNQSEENLNILQDENDLTKTLENYNNNENDLIIPLGTSNTENEIEKISNINKFENHVIENLEDQLLEEMNSNLSFDNSSTDYEQNCKEAILQAEQILDVSNDLTIDDDENLSPQVTEQNIDESGYNQPTTLTSKETTENIASEESKLPSKEKRTDSQEQNKTEFLNDIIYQLDEMFTRYPEEDVLNSIIPNSRFIKVDADKPYVLGVIYEDKQLKYIAYGVPGQYNSLPPADLGQHYQWLPLNPQDVMSDGYFMIYQDAVMGNLVEINFEQ